MDFFVLLMLDFLSGAVVLAAVVVSFWLAQEETRKPTTTRAVIVQISECFIGYGLTSARMSRRRRKCKH